MNKKLKNIEQLYSESFNDFRLEPSSGLWKRISSKLAWKSFFTFNPTTLNAYYIAGILAVSVAGALWLTKPVTDNNQEINEITINNERPKAEGGRQKEEDSIKIKVKSKKIKVKDEDPLSKKEMKPVPKPALPTEVLTKEVNQQPALSSVVLTKEDNLKLVTPKLTSPIINDSKTKIDISQLATPHPKPHTQNPTRNQKPETSNQSPDPWPNMDSLFTNFNTPSPPQHSIQFPNAFTPNSNGPTNGYYTPGLPNNDVFHPVYKGVTEYHLSIFNRRGELIFESNEINVGWDGYINDRLAAQGVYIWKARGKYSNGENFVKFGNIMLIIK